MATEEGNASSRSLLGSLRQYIAEFDPNKGTDQTGTNGKINLKKAWNDWINNFEDCLELEEIPVGKWLRILKILGGQQLREKMESLCTDGMNYEEQKEKLKDYFEDKRAINAIRYDFFNTVQGKQEPTRKYVERCKDIGKEAEFDKFNLDNAILYNLCQYTPHDRVRNEILMKELTLDEALKYSTSIEMTKREAKIMKKESAEQEEDINAIKRKPGKYSKISRLKERDTREQKNRTQLQENWHGERNTHKCVKCGRSHGYNDCPAANTRCHGCGRRGHFKKQCFSRRKINKIHETSSSESNSFSEISEQDASSEISEQDDCF